ncbi:MAG: RNA polymerase sigma factor [Acidobacteria bacterium]|nr:RNA polymerase sigma factor [Acidobacteriota bacterium]
MPEDASVTNLRSSLEALFTRNGEKWRRFIMTIVKNREDAEDVLQEAIGRVLARNRPLPSQDQVRMYLGRAIGNAALEFYNTRMRQRRKHLPIQEQLLRPAHVEGPDALLEERERRTRKEYLLKILRRELRRLPEKQVQAIRLTLLDKRGLSIRDVGAANGIPYSTLRHRSRQGLKRMRRRLERALEARTAGNGGEIRRRGGRTARSPRKS